MGGNSVVNPLGRNFLGTGGTPLNKPISGLFGGLANISHPLANVFDGGNKNTSVSGPFSLDPNQYASDKSAIQAEGQKQYQDTLGAIDTNAAEQQKYAGDTINRMLPGIYEDLNSKHLLNSSATGDEIGRQASYLGQDVASQRATAIQQALAGKQSFDTGSLQRGLSLEDFINQSNVAKTIGAQMAPQVGNGKGTAVSGLGAGATAGTSIMPGWGTAIGGGLGYLAGGGLNGGGSRGGK